MGAPSGGGGSSSTVNQTKSWAEYVPPETYEAYKQLMPKLGAKYDVGLTPEEKQYYTGQTMADTASQFSSAGKTLNENLTRTGVKGGAAAEAYGDLARSKAMAGSTGLASISGLDLQKKSENTSNIMKAISLPGSPIQTGSTTTYSPSKGGGS